LPAAIISEENKAKTPDLISIYVNAVLHLSKQAGGKVLRAHLGG